MDREREQRADRAAEEFRRSLRTYEQNVLTPEAIKRQDEQCAELNDFRL